LERASALAAAERSKLLDCRLSLAHGGAGYTFIGRSLRKPLLVLMALVGVVLLLACANLASVLLGRAAARSREMAIRLAIGAGRTRLVRQLLTESLALAVVGGGLGLLFAMWGARVLVERYTDQRFLQMTVNVTPDLGILAFTAILSLSAGVLFGLVPAFRGASCDVSSVLKGAGARVRLGRWDVRKLLVVSQVALSLVLLVGAGLFVRTLARLKTLDVGFEREHLVTFSVSTTTGYGSDADPAIWRLLDKVRQSPGVIAASGAAPSPPYEYRLPVQVQRYLAASGEDRLVSFSEVAGGFFETLRAPLLEGRPIGPQDRGRKVAVVNASFARHFFGRGSAVGRSVDVAGNTGRVEIVGVVADARYFNPREKPRRAIFASTPYLWPGSLIVRTATDPRALMAELPQLVRQSEPGLRLLRMETFGEATDKLLTQERMLADLSGAFSVLAVVLASLGIYGVLSYAVAQRTREIGIRMALGARPVTVIRMVLRETLILLLAGLAVGIPVILVWGRFLASLLYELKPADPGTIVMAGLLLSAVAVLAGWVPARRASRIAPMEALWHD